MNSIALDMFGVLCESFRLSFVIFLNISPTIAFGIKYHKIIFILQHRFGFTKTLIFFVKFVMALFVNSKLNIWITPTMNMVHLYLISWLWYYFPTKITPPPCTLIFIFHWIVFYSSISIILCQILHLFNFEYWIIAIK